MSKLGDAMAQVHRTRDASLAGRIETFCRFRMGMTYEDCWRRYGRANDLSDREAEEDWEELMQETERL